MPPFQKKDMVVYTNKIISNHYIMNSSIDYHRKYRENNSERIHQNHKHYVEKNIDKVRLIRKAYYNSHREEILIKRHQYRENNRDGILDYQREYREKNRQNIQHNKNTKHSCSCGGCFTTSNKQQHMRSIKHIKWEDMQSMDTNISTNI